MYGTVQISLESYLLKLDTRSITYNSRTKTSKMGNIQICIDK